GLDSRSIGYVHSAGSFQYPHFHRSSHRAFRYRWVRHSPTDHLKAYNTRVSVRAYFVHDKKRMETISYTAANFFWLPGQWSRAFDMVSIFRNDYLITDSFNLTNE